MPSLKSFSCWALLHCIGSRTPRQSELTTARRLIIDYLWWHDVNTATHDRLSPLPPIQRETRLHVRQQLRATGNHRSSILELNENDLQAGDRRKTLAIRPVKTLISSPPHDTQRGTLFHTGSLCWNFATTAAVEYPPECEILGEVLVMMLGSGSDEQEVA